MLIACHIGSMQYRQLPPVDRIRAWFEEIDCIVASFFQPGLNEITDQLGVAAMTVDDDDLVETVACDLVTGGFEEIPNDALGKRKATGHMPGLVDLTIKIIGEDDGIFLLRRPRGPFSHLDQIAADRHVRSMFFQDTDREDTGT